MCVCGGVGGRFCLPFQRLALVTYTPEDIVDIKGNEDCGLYIQGNSTIQIGAYCLYYWLEACR